MASSDYLPIGADPDLQAARTHAINQAIAPDTEPPPPEHPAITYAKNLLSPMGPYGGYQQGPAASWQMPATLPTPAPTAPSGGFTVPGSYQYPAQQTIGPDLNQMWNDPSNPVGWLKQQLDKVGETPAQYVGPGLLGMGPPQGSQRPTTIGDIGALFRPATREQSDNPLFALGPEGNFAGNIGEALGPAVGAIGRKVFGAGEQALRPGLAAAAGKDIGAGEGTNLERMLAQGADQTKLPQRAASDVADAAAGRVPTTDVSTTPRYTVEVGKTRSLIRDTQTGETLPQMFTGKDLGEAAAQAKADALNAPTPVNPFAVPQEASVKAAVGYVTKAKANPVGDTVGDVVRRAARSNPEIVTPEFLAAQADVRTQIDKALTTAKLPVSDENATAVARQLLAQEKARPSVGNRNAQAVVDALTGGAKPTEEDVATAFASGETTPGAGYPGGGAPPQGPSGPIRTTGGAMPPDVPFPSGAPRSTAKAVMVGLSHLLLDIPRGMMLISHLPLLRQAPPLMADALLSGRPQAIAQALYRPLRAVISSDLEANALNDGLRQAVESAGVRTGADGVQISSLHGPLTTLEEYGLRSILNRVPGIANLNRIFPVMLNSLRADAAVALAKQTTEAGLAIDSKLIGRRVNIASGRGYLYPGDVGASGEFQNAMGGMFFGPRLATSSWQAGTETLLALKDIGRDVLSRKAINPADAFQIRTIAGYVATGIGIMKLANTFGLDIVTDPTSHDWGRIVLPDGSRVDLWGAFGPSARLVAQELEWANATYIEHRPQKFGADNGLDILGNYFRSKLNPGLPAKAADVLAGKTMGGQPTTPQTLLDPSQYLPLGIQEAMKGGGGALGAVKTALVETGAGVVDTPRRFVYDGLGTKQGDPNFQNDPILAEHSRLAQADPQFSKSGPDLSPHDGTIGSGHNELALDPASLDRFMSELGTQRRAEIAKVISSLDYKNATIAQQEKMYTAAKNKADTQAERNFLKDDVISSTDPATIVKEAVNGFTVQSTAKDHAYWIGVLDKAGKLTPDVIKAIDESKVVLPGDRTPTTVAEYLRAAPLIHEYLKHVPYGTDTHPIGTPADWSAAAAYTEMKNQRRDELIRAGMNTTVAEVRAQADVLKTIPSLVQKNLFLNGTQLENPQRTLLAKKYPFLAHFISSQHKAPSESEAEYQSFPRGAP